MWIDFLIQELSDDDKYNEVMNFKKKDFSDGNKNCII